MEKFIEQIIKNLENNGFPSKKVSLPTEKMYEIADSKGFSFNAVLAKMQESHQVHYEVGADKIVFSKLAVNEKDFPNINPEMISKVQEMLSKMDPAELQKIQEQVANMSEADRQEMMAKAKDMGLF